MNQPPPIPSIKSSQASVDSKTSRVAIWSLVFGVSSFCLWVVGAVLALVLGVIALVQISGSQGRLQGKAIAITGLVTGGVGLFVGLMLVGIAMPSFMAIKESSASSREMDAVMSLLVGCRSFAADRDGETYPKSLQDLYPNYIDDESLLSRPKKQTGQLVSYSYFAGHSLLDPVSVLIASPEYGRGFRAVGFTDGRVERMPEAEYQHLLQREIQSEEAGEQMKVVKQLVLTCYSYASEHEGVFPETLHQLFPVYLEDVSLLVAGDGKNGTSVGYVYFPGLSNTSHSKAPLVASPFVIEQKRVVGFVGGHVLELAEDEYQKLLKSSQGNQ